MATHSSILAWVITWTEKPGGLQSMGSQESDMTQQLNNNDVIFITIYFYVVSTFCLYYGSFREGDGTPLQYFCLENSMDGGAW